MSGYEVGTAYVRIRPQMSSFRAETQTGIRSAFSTVGKVILPTLAFAGVTEAVRKSVQQAEIKQVITGQLKNAFTTAGLSYREYASVVDTTIRRQEKLGFTFDESAQALGRSVRATRSAALATKLQAVAADLARGQNVGLLQATQILIRAFNGQTSGLKRLGIETAKHAKGVAVLDAVEKRFAGSAGKYADTAAGSQARLSAAIEETQALIGSALTPAVGKLNTRLADWLNNTEHQKEIQRDVNEVVRVGGIVVHDLASAFDVLKGPVGDVVKNLGGFENVAQKALVIGIVLKARSAFGALSSVSAAARTMGSTVAAESEVGSAALAQTAASGQRSAGLIDRALLRVGQRLSGIAVASGRTATKVAADARREATALATVGVAAQRTAKKSSFGSVTGVGGGLKTATAAGAIEAAALETTLTGLSKATEDFAQTSTTETAQFVKQGLGKIVGVQTSVGAATKTTAQAFTDLSATVTGTSAAVVTGLEAETRAVQGLGVAATEATTTVGGLQGLLGRTLVRAGGGRAAAAGSLEANLLTGSGLRSIVGRVGLLASRATSIGLGAYIANSLIQGLTGFDVAGAAAKGLRNAFRTAPSASEKAFGRAGALARSAGAGDLDALKLARVQAELTVKADRLALSQEQAAHSSLQWQEKSLTLTTDLTKLTTAVDALRGSQRKQRSADQAQLAGIVAVGKGASDAQFKLAGGFKAAAFQANHASYLYNKLGGVLYQTAQAAKQAGSEGYIFAEALRKATDADNSLTRVQQHNNELVAEFATILGRQPTKRETTLILRNRNALANLQEVADKYNSLRAALAKGINLNVYTVAQPRGPHDLPLPGAVNLGANAPKTLAFSKATLLKRAYELAESTANPAAIKAAAAAYLNFVNQSLAFVQREKPHTKKQRDKLNQEFDNLVGIQGQLQAELTSIAANAAAKAKAAAAAAARRAAAARARAKAAAAREHRAYLGDIADRETTLRRAASTTRAAVIKEAGLARTVGAERAKGDDVVAQAFAQYPALRKFRSLFAFKKSAAGAPGSGGGAFGSESYQRGEPSSFNKSKFAIQLFGKGNRAKDVAGEIVSHFLVNGVDPALTRYYNEFARSLTTAQNAWLKREYARGGRQGSFAKFAKVAGIPALFRGSLFGQLDSGDTTYTAKQRRIFAGVLSELGKIPTSSPASLVARVKKADDAVIAVYRQAEHDSKLTKAERRKQKNLRLDAQKQERADIASVRATVQAARDDALSLALSQEQLAIAQGKGSPARLARLQAEQEAGEKKLLREQVARYSRRADNASLSVAARLRASKQATDAENKFVVLQETDATRQKNSFTLALGAIENQVAAAGNDQPKLDAAYARERKLLNRWIDFDKKRLKLYKGNVDLTQQYKADIQQQRRRLIDLNQQKNGKGGFTLSDFYASATADFKEYGSNISTGGLLSPGDFRGLIDGIALLAKKAASPGKGRGHVTVNQVFNDPRDPYAGMRAAQLAAEHLYYGG